MLTPEQIKKHNFRSAGKGLYRSEDVDAFLQEAAEAYAKTREEASEQKKNNDELYQRVEALANALNQLRAERELIQKTMIVAQKAAEDITAKAEAESERTTREAKTEAERLSRESQAEASLLVRSAKAEAEKLLLETRAQAENIQAQAQARADSLFEEARAKAQTELVRISGEIQKQEEELLQIRKETARFRSELLNAVARQMELIEQMPDDGQDAVLLQEPTRLEPQITLVKAEPEPVAAVTEVAAEAEEEPAIEPAAEAEEEPEAEDEAADATAAAAEEAPAALPEDMFADLEAALDSPEDGFHFVK